MPKITLIPLKFQKRSKTEKDATDVNIVSKTL